MKPEILEQFANDPKLQRIEIHHPNGNKTVIYRPFIVELPEVGNVCNTRSLTQLELTKLQSGQ